MLHCCKKAKFCFVFRQMGVAYISSTTTAVAVSVGLNSFVKVTLENANFWDLIVREKRFMINLCSSINFFQRAPPLVARYVPFVAVAAANCVNIPLSRQR